MAEYGCPHCSNTMGFSYYVICDNVYGGRVFDEYGELSDSVLEEANEAGYAQLPDPYYVCDTCNKEFDAPVKIEDE